MKALRTRVMIAAILMFAAGLFAEQVRIKKEEVPQVVLNTVEKISPGYTFAGARKLINEEGQTGLVYQVDARNGSQGLRIRIMPDGKLVEWWDMTQKLADTPEAARKTIETACGGPPDILLKVTRPDSKPFYRFRLTRSVATDGTLKPDPNLGRMEEVKNEDVPKPVQDAVAKLAPSAEWAAVKISGGEARYGTGYAVKLTRGGKFFVVSPDGKVVEQRDLRAKFAETPEAVKKTVLKATAGGEKDPDDLIKIMPAGSEPLYVFRITRDVAENGTVLPKEKD